MGDGPKMPRPGLPRLDYDRTPFLVIWETTQSCDLACIHCRASAQPARDSGELSTEEGRDLLDQASALGVPIFILSGGDPLKRPDLYDLIRHGAGRGLRMATVPAATPLLTENVVRQLKEAGLSQMAVSIDFPRADLHDSFRGVPGAFERSLRAAGWAHAHGLPLQVNTTLFTESAAFLDEMVALVRKLEVVFWEVFFLVPTGRGKAVRGLTPGACEEIFETLYRVQKGSDFLVKVTEAPHFRRYVMQREGMAPRCRPSNGSDAGERAVLPAQLVRTEGPGHTIGLAPRGVNAGNGFLFVSHRGEVYPSGFLPLSAGNIRERTLEWLYRESPLFQRLRTPGALRGICGVCEFNEVCGGSRSRAYALTGDWMASDPSCAYRPARGAQRPPTLPSPA